jgi:hypothetical protein
VNEQAGAGSTVGHAADERWALLRQQLRDAMLEKGYTYEDVAYLARISLRSVYSLFSGEQKSRIDTVMRVALVVGARIELDFSKSEDGLGDDASPLPLLEPKRATRSIGKRRLTTSQGSVSRLERDDESNNVASKRKSAKKSAADQRKTTPSKPRETRKYNEEVVYLRNYIRGRHQARLRRSA